MFIKLVIGIMIMLSTSLSITSPFQFVLKDKSCVLPRPHICDFLAKKSKCRRKKLVEVILDAYQNFLVYHLKE